MRVDIVCWDVKGIRIQRIVSMLKTNLVREETFARFDEFVQEIQLVRWLLRDSDRETICFSEQTRFSEQKIVEI